MYYGYSVGLMQSVFGDCAVVEGCIALAAPRNKDLPPSEIPIVHFDLEPSNGKKQVPQIMRCLPANSNNSFVYRSENARTSLYPAHPQSPSNPSKINDN